MDMAKKSLVLKNQHSIVVPSLLLLLVSLLVSSVIVWRTKPENIRSSTSSSSSLETEALPEPEPAAAMAATTATTTTTTTATSEIFGVKIEKNPPQSKLDDLGVASWPKWGCQPSKFPWTFDATETMYLLQGKVIVYVEGYEGSFEIGGGDLVVFPKGMKITWDVIEAVNKHYSLEK